MTQQSEIKEIARAMRSAPAFGPGKLRIVSIDFDVLARAAYEVMARSDGELSRRAVRDKWTKWKAGEISADDALNAIFDLAVCPPLPDPPSSIRELPHD